MEKRFFRAENSIEVYSPDEVDNKIRFFVDDRYMDGDRLQFIQANFNQHVMVLRPRELPYEIYSNDDMVIREIVDNLKSITGLDIPDDFVRGTSIYNVRGILQDRSLHVSHRVLRQQIFLSARTSPIAPGDTWHNLFNAIGNAIWNFLDYKVWNDRTRKADVKNYYREIRGIPQDYQRTRNGAQRGRPPQSKHQKNLFYIAAEDFRFLFSSAMAGRGEWFLDNEGFMPISPPSDKVVDFWIDELRKYDEIYSSRSESSEQEAPVAETDSSELNALSNIGVSPSVS